MHRVVSRLALSRASALGGPVRRRLTASVAASGRWSLSASSSVRTFAAAARDPLASSSSSSPLAKLQAEIEEKSSRLDVILERVEEQMAADLEHRLDSDAEAEGKTDADADADGGLNIENYLKADELALFDEVRKLEAKRAALADSRSAGISGVISAAAAKRNAAQRAKGASRAEKLGRAIAPHKASAQDILDKFGGVAADAAAPKPDAAAEAAPAAEPETQTAAESENVDVADDLLDESEIDAAANPNAEVEANAPLRPAEVEEVLSTLNLPKHTYDPIDNPAKVYPTHPIKDAVLRKYPFRIEAEVDVPMKMQRNKEYQYPHYKGKMYVNTNDMALPPAVERVFLEIVRFRNQGGRVAFVARNYGSVEACEEKLYAMLDSTLTAAKRIAAEFEAEDATDADLATLRGAVNTPAAPAGSTDAMGVLLPFQPKQSKIGHRRISLALRPSGFELTALGKLRAPKLPTGQIDGRSRVYRTPEQKQADREAYKAERKTRIEAAIAAGTAVKMTKPLTHAAAVARVAQRKASHQRTRLQNVLDYWRVSQPTEVDDAAYTAKPEVFTKDGAAAGAAGAGTGAGADKTEHYRR